MKKLKKIGVLSALFCGVCFVVLLSSYVYSWDDYVIQPYDFDAPGNYNYQQRERDREREQQQQRRERELWNLIESNECDCEDCLNQLEQREQQRELMRQREKPFTSIYR